MARVTGILETALYVRDMDEALRFYRRLFGFPVMVADERFAALDVAGRQVLLLFLEGSSRSTLRLPGGTIPPHGGSGPLHFAFAIDRDDLEGWEGRLRDEGIPIEGRMDWERGGVSLYFRDPDGHLVELATPGIWPTY